MCKYIENTERNIVIFLVCVHTLCNEVDTDPPQFVYITFHSCSWPAVTLNIQISMVCLCTARWAFCNVFILLFLLLQQNEVTDSAYLGSESTYSECETFTDEDTGALVPPEMHEDVETDSGIEATLHDPEDGRNRSVSISPLIVTYKMPTLANVLI